LGRVIEGAELISEDKYDGHIYIGFLRAQVDELRKYAEEIDREYSEN